MTHYDYGNPNWKSIQVTWQRPEVWTHQGYKFWMYQSSNGFLLWRCLKAIKPNGSPFQMTMQFKTNIANSRKKAQEYLRSQVTYDQLTAEEKDERERQSRFLF